MSHISSDSQASSSLLLLQPVMLENLRLNNLRAVFLRELPDHLNTGGFTQALRDTLKISVGTSTFSSLTDVQVENLTEKTVQSYMKKSSAIPRDPAFKIACFVGALREKVRGQSRSSIAQTPSRAGAGAGAGAGAEKVVNGVSFSNLESLNTVNKTYCKLRYRIIEKILSDVENSDGLRDILAEVRKVIESNTAIPRHIKTSKQYLLHCLMRELTPTIALKKENYSKGIHSIVNVKQVLEAYEKFRVVDDSNFLKCADVIQTDYPRFAPGLNDITAIRTWMEDPVNQNILHGISKLDFNSCSLTSIPRNFLKFFPKAQNIYFDINKIQEIHPGTFTGLILLKELGISFNQIQEVHSGTFIGLTSLETLLLNNSKIREIHSGTFTGLTSLKTLFLNESQIGKIHPEAYTALASLDAVFLDDSEIGKNAPRA